MHKAYLDGDLTPAEFRDWYNDPNNYRPELPGNNRGHAFEWGLLNENKSNSTT